MQCCALHLVEVALQDCDTGRRCDDFADFVLSLNFLDGLSDADCGVFDRDQILQEFVEYISIILERLLSVVDFLHELVFDRLFSLENRLSNLLEGCG